MTKIQDGKCVDIYTDILDKDAVDICVGDIRICNNNNNGVCHSDFSEKSKDKILDSDSESEFKPEDPESKKLKLESRVFPISVVDKAWQYRGEGGANLVISLRDRNQVVRFSKSKYPEKDHDAKILEIAFYANEVMRNALGNHYVRPISIGVVSDEDFEHVRLEAQQFRPLERCKKDIMSHRVILSPDCVFLTPDYLTNTFGDTFSVEIKPKQGWHSEKATCAVDLCNRCLKQYAKLCQGKIDRISRYCPLDLFSGDKYRMKRAIFDLYENPHNRFKIYKNGDLIYTENKGDSCSVEKELREWLLSDKVSELVDNDSQPGLHHLAALLCTVLLSNLDPKSQEFLLSHNHKASSILSNILTSQGSSFPDFSTNQKTSCPNLSNQEPSYSTSISVPVDLISLELDDDSKRRKFCCNTRSEQLPHGCILQSVLSLQQHTDISDHEAKVLCEKLLNNIDDLERLHQLILWHPMTVLEKSAKSILELKEKGLSFSEIEDLQQLQRFLLSVTAKDVSLLITFRQIIDISHETCFRLPVVRLGEKYFRVMVSVIDLDPKPVHRISNWVKRKEEWLQIYRLNAMPDKKPGLEPVSKCLLQVESSKLDPKNKI